MKLPCVQYILCLPSIPKVYEICRSPSIRVCAYTVSCAVNMGFFDVLGVLCFLVVLFLVVQLVRIAISDCDLGIRGRNLKWEYFSGKVVWVVGAGGGSEFT